MRKIITTFALLLLSAVSLWAQTEIDDIYYNLHEADSTAAVAAAPTGSGYTGDIAIPASVSYGGVDYAVTSIEKRAFLGCSSLSGIDIPSSVTSIGKSAFYNCTSLTGISIPSLVMSIEDYAFRGCTELSSVSFSSPSSVTKIGEYAFQNCIGLTDITIPSSVKSIRIGAFQNCTGLTDITIPSLVTFIGVGAFNGCTNITSITCETTTPPTVGTDAFYRVPTNIPVTVPHGTVEAYKKADGWSYFNYFVEAAAAAVGTVQADKGLGVSGRVVSNPEGAVVRVFTLGGTQVLCSSETVIDLGGLPTGVYVVRANGMGQKVVVR